MFQKLKRTIIFFIMCFMMTSTVFADIVTLNYYPNYYIDGDEEELDDWGENDDYTFLTLDDSTAFSLKYALKLGRSNNPDIAQKNVSIFVYADYTKLNLENNKEDETGKYQSITCGFSILGEKYYNKYFGTSFSSGFGIGGSRFELSESEHAGTFEMFLEGGVSFYKHLYLSVGGKLQIIGLPGETMAEAVGLYMGLSVKY